MIGDARPTQPRVMFDFDTAFRDALVVNSREWGKKREYDCLIDAAEKLYKYAQELEAWASWAEAELRRVMEQLDTGMEFAESLELRIDMQRAILNKNNEVIAQLKKQINDLEQEAAKTEKTETLWKASEVEK